MKYTITINCCFCSSKVETSVELPDGWEHRYGGIDDEDDGFCPKHAMVSGFADDQCAGCVGGWGDCGLWRSFAASNNRSISDRDLTTIENGICPFRVNGLIQVSPNKIVENVDISNPANATAGKALADAIREYCREFPAPGDSP